MCAVYETEYKAVATEEYTRWEWVFGPLCAFA